MCRPERLGEGPLSLSAIRGSFQAHCVNAKHCLAENQSASKELLFVCGDTEEESFCLGDAPCCLCIRGMTRAVSHELPPDMVFVRRPFEAGFKQEMYFQTAALTWS